MRDLGDARGFDPGAASMNGAGGAAGIADRLTIRLRL